MVFFYSVFGNAAHDKWVILEKKKYLPSASLNDFIDF